jgi:CO dehydrogenase maturation factor
MKIAITGKGGTGKTTVAALFSHLFRKNGYEVMAVDADPDANLAEALGATEKERASIIPISAQRKLIEERTGAKPRQFGQLFRLNPTVKDIPDRLGVSIRGIKLIVMGGIVQGGDGCACPENVLLRSLLSEIILNRKEAVVVDMEAGIEHLGRATAKFIDIMVIVVEPGKRSIETAATTLNLGRQLGIERFGVIGNKFQNQEQEKWMRNQFPEDLYMGSLSYSPVIQNSDISGQPLIDLLDESLTNQFQTVYSSLFLDPT